MNKKISREQPSSNEGPPDRYQAGWRAGKPVEDPEKTKRWGFVTAKPSEYLICVKQGNIHRRRSGQGARIFKWPWEAVAIVPTTIQKIDFVADQITRERVGVTVSGIAVYRIAEPELAYRVLNFTYGESATEKLSRTLREMFIGAARRLIANLSLDECLMRRKEAIASFLMTEIAPVVGGHGSLGDSTDQGWGVVIDTIEIQDVHIQSMQVFAHLQAPYRAEIAARAELAELERSQKVMERRVETERRAKEAAISADRETRLLKARAESESAEAESRLAEAEHLVETRRLEQERERQQLALATELDLRERRQHVELELRRRELETRRQELSLDAEREERQAAIERMLSQSRALRDMVTIGLPQIAKAFEGSFGPVHYTHIGTSEGDAPLNLIAGAIGQVLAIARGLGLDPSEHLRKVREGDGE